jgi:hypothetical protein
MKGWGGKGDEGFRLVPLVGRRQLRFFPVDSIFTGSAHWRCFLWLTIECLTNSANGPPSPPWSLARFSMDGNATLRAPCQRLMGYGRTRLTAGQHGRECSHLSKHVSLVGQKHVEISAWQFYDSSVGDPGEKIAFPSSLVLLCYKHTI